MGFPWLSVRIYHEKKAANVKLNDVISLYNAGFLCWKKFLLVDKIFNMV